VVSALSALVQKLFGLMHYLEPLKDPKFDPSRTAPAAARSASQLRDLSYLISLFKHRALMAVYESGLRYTAAAAKPGVTASEAFNSCSLNLAETARSHCYYFMLTHFADMVSGCPDPKVAAVMKRVCALFALSNIIDGHQWHGRIDATALGFVETAVAELLAEIRPDAVPLVDAFEFHDRVRVVVTDFRLPAVFPYWLLVHTRSLAPPLVVLMATCTRRCMRVLPSPN
jgi:Acyl-CoA oxidase